MKSSPRSCVLGIVALPMAALAQPSFRGVGDQPGGLTASSVAGVSADGRFVVGYSNQLQGVEAFRWTAVGGLVPLGELSGGVFESMANAVSANGYHVVGQSRSAPGAEGFRWKGGLMTGMGDLAGGGYFCYASSVSADGLVIAGAGTVDDHRHHRRRAWRSASGGPLTDMGYLWDGFKESHSEGISADGAIVAGSSVSVLGNEAFRWTQAGGMVGIGDLPGGTFYSQGEGISADGSVVVGNSTSASGIEAFRWTQGGGMEGLGDLPGGAFEGYAMAASADGSVIVGMSKVEGDAFAAFIWDAQNGMRNLKTVLDGLGVAGLDDWRLLVATGISGDGLTVAGNGINPDGNTEGFVAFLGQPFTQTTERASITNAEQQAAGGSSGGSVSGDGNIVAFWSNAANLVAGDTNAKTDIFIRNRAAGSTTRASVSTLGIQGNGNSVNPHTSGSGRYIVFASDATNLAGSDTNGQRDIFLRDRIAGTTTRVSLTFGGAQANGPCDWPRVTPDGRFIVFQSNATNLVAGDTNGATDIFLRDRQAGTTTRLSVNSAGLQGNGASTDPSISDNGLSVAFTSLAANLIAGDTNVTSDIFLRNRQSNVTTRLSVASDGVQGNQASFAARISGNGRYTAFTSSATTLAPSDTNGVDDVFVRDRFNATTTRISITPAQGNGGSAAAAISSNGRYVLYNSDATNLVAGDTNGLRDAFIHDNWTFLTRRASLGHIGQQASSDCFGTSLSADGRFAAFFSLAGNLVPGDTGFGDVFLRDLRKP